MSNILLISAPGAGKGVTSKYLKEKYNMVHMSIGNLLREESEKNTSLKEKLANGEFIENNKTVYLSTHTPLGYEHLENKKIIDLENPPETVYPN